MQKLRRKTGSWSKNRSHFGAHSCACSSVSPKRSAGLRMGRSACTKILRTASSPSLSPLSGYTPSYDPLPVRRLHHPMTCSPSTSSSSSPPFSKLAGCFTTTPSSPPHIRLPSPFSPSPQTSLQSLVCCVSYSACLSQFLATSSIHLRSCVSPLIPSTMANIRQGQSVTPEDYTSLWGWVTFFWVKPLVDLGRDTTLNETDVWNLSPTMQSRPIFVKFSAIAQSTLLRRLWTANSLDLMYTVLLPLNFRC